MNSESPPAIVPESLGVPATAVATSNLVSLNAILKNCQLPNVEEYSNSLETRTANLEAIIMSQSTKIRELNVQKQQLTSSFVEMGKNYAALHNDNQMWKHQCKSLVDARVKFENEEVNVLRSAYADKLKESSELNLELTTCQNQLKTIKDVLQKTDEFKNVLLTEKHNLEQKSRKADENFEKALKVAQNLNNKCKMFEDMARNSEQEFKQLKINVDTQSAEISSLKQQNEVLLLNLNSKDHCTRFWMDSYINLNLEKGKMLLELEKTKLKMKEEVISSKQDVSTQSCESWTSKNDAKNFVGSQGNREMDICSFKAIIDSPPPLPRQYCTQNFTKGKQHELMIFCISHPESFYVRLIARQYAMATFVSRFNKYYGESGNRRPLAVFNVGALCVATRTTTARCFRGRLVSCRGEKVVVDFVDYGYQSALSANEVFEISDEFIQEPIFAVHSRLKRSTADVRATRSSFNAQERQIFRKVLHHTKFLGVFVDNHHKGICRWELYNQATKQSIAQCLVDAYSELKAETANKV